MLSPQQSLCIRTSPLRDNYWLAIAGPQDKLCSWCCGSIRYNCGAVYFQAVIDLLEGWMLWFAT